MRMKLRGVAVLFAVLASVGLCGAQEKAAAPVAVPSPSEKKVLSPEAFLELRSLQDPQFSPDGARVAYVVNEPRTSDPRARHIWLYDLRTHSTRQLTYSAKSESYPRWSPDGKRLAFLSNRGAEQQIYLLRMEGGEAVAVTKGKGGVTSFTWAPDGETIAFLGPDAKTDAEEKKEKDKDDAKIVDKDEKQARL